MSFTRFAPVLPARERVRARLSHGQSGRCLYDAVTAGDEAEVTALLRQDPSLIATVVRLDEGEAPYDGNDGDLLTFAVAADNPRMVALLLELGAHPDGERPGIALRYALLADAPAMAEMLLAAGASPNPLTPESPAPFVTALRYGNVGAVRMLVRHGLDVDRTDEFGDSDLLRATGIGAFVIAEVLVDAGSNPWRVGMGGAMPVQAIAGGGGEGDEERSARERLVARVRKPGLPWPPPPVEDVRDQLARTGELPPEWRAAGMVAAPVVIEMLRP